MRLTMNGVESAVPTVEAAARMLVTSQPRRAECNGIVIDEVAAWTTESAVDAVATAMSAGDWYWLDGSAYCPACVECESPAIDATDPSVQRGGAVSVCACCGTDYQS